MKQAFLLKLLQPLASFASGIGKRKKLLIMIYHRVLDEPDFMRPGEVDKEKFTWQMELLAKHFNVLPLPEALERMQSDTLPSRAVCITFDDGYADNYTNALPILQQFNLKATFFIASGFLDGGRMWNDTVIESVRNLSTPILDLAQQGLGVFEIANETQKSLAAQQIIQKIKHLDFAERAHYVEAIAVKSENLPEDLMMTSEQVKKLHISGMEIGGHTVNHPILAKLDDEIAKWEIGENKKFLENLLGIELRCFAYPNGKPEIDYGWFHTELVKQSGFHSAVSTQWNVATKHSNFYELPRFTPWDTERVKFMARLIFFIKKQSCLPYFAI
ncbi:polysaccharide deacetylase family protein [Methylomonas sp. SURF-2]|uniref:Polysaccharide deacetylase family protein n=1 Tax=Methylomonas subterranea TaxID=2952225 RepID=A0ABT1TCW0_9GAMM|nr:polysaccharide deacetylase family protein [Methylomonas sp. SURF-2]MCQ8103096.1 polysaccharide deacetylase family protein [Methylomonas sp. SURF-2]